MLDTLKVLLAAVLCIGTCVWIVRTFHMSKRNPRRLPLPPGPRGLPFLGSVREISSGKLWETFQKWSDQYGDVVYLEAMGQGMLALNSVQSIGDLYEKRGQNYSERPQNPSFDMLEIGWNWAFSNYGSFVRANRRVFHKSFGQREVIGYLPIVEQQAVAYIQRLLKDPINFSRHTKELRSFLFIQKIIVLIRISLFTLIRYFANTLVHVSYGEGDDAWTKKMAEQVEGVGLAITKVVEPGRFLVDLIPPLRYVPAWFPGAEWKQHLMSLSAYANNVYHTTFEEALTRWRNGTQGTYPNVLKSLFAELPSEEDPAFQPQAELIKSSTFVAYLAGVDTQTSAAMGMILALAMHPEVQKRCHEEVDTILGPYRLPTPSDIANLRYIRAVVEEAIRWHLPLPLGLPHVVKKDDEYNGYFIPKGTIVFANNWAVSRDKNLFDDPLQFKPERHLKKANSGSSYLGSEAAAFGFGRRTCPGSHMAVGSLTFMIAALVSVFHIRPARDQDGHDIPLKYDLEPVLVSNVLPFKCNITPRSEKHAALILDM